MCYAISLGGHGDKSKVCAACFLSGSMRVEVGQTVADLLSRCWLQDCLGDSSRRTILSKRTSSSEPNDTHLEHKLAY